VLALGRLIPPSGRESGVLPDIPAPPRVVSQGIDRYRRHLTGSPSQSDPRSPTAEAGGTARQSRSGSNTCLGAAPGL